MSNNIESISEILLYQIKNENIQHRLNTVNNIFIIAKSYGKDKTLEEIIPLLSDSLADEDEVLLSLAKEIPKLVEVVGVDNVVKLVPLLDEISRVEELIVRETAVEGLLVLLGQIQDDKVVIDTFMPLLKSLAEDDWFSPKISCCGLIPQVYNRVNKRCRRQLREIYQALASDETPMVRRATAKYLREFSENIEKHYLITDIMAILATLSQDEQDTVRLICVDNIICMGEKIADDQKFSLLLPIIEDLSRDLSWKVRYELGKNYFELTTNVFASNPPPEVIHIFITLLGDSEMEVRSCVCDKVTRICKNLPIEDFMRDIFPILRNLVNDESQLVRASLASDVNNYSVIVGKENTLEHLVPMILILLRDESHEVRFNAIKSVMKLEAVIGIDELKNRLLNAIITLSDDSQWRVRSAIVRIIPEIASAMSVDEFSQFVPIYINWMTGVVATVRIEAVKLLIPLTEIYGIQWVFENMVEKLINFEAPNFRIVVAAINVIEEIYKFLTPEQIEIATKYTIENAENKVPNVRLNVCKCLSVLSEIASNKDTILSTLNTLKADPDSDVQYEAIKALEQQ